MGCTHSGYFAGEFLSTSSAGRTTDLLGVLASPTKVSIHVLREKDDAQARSTLSWASMISIHVLREEDDGVVLGISTAQYKFLSTSSARRTTVISGADGAGAWISIHVLREEDDQLG